MTTLSATDAATTVTTAAASQGVPTVPVSTTPSGLIVGNGGVIGGVTQLLGTTENSLFSNSSGYVTDGSLKVNSANFSQGYSTVSALGIPLLNLTPVGSVLTTTGGTVLGGTGENSHLTLVGGVTSDSYITNINNGAAGGVLGLLLPNQAPAWASTCLNVLGLVKESCWAVNAAQDNQVLVGDGASANGSEEVVIGTNASHTLPTVDACTAFPGSGNPNDPTDPCGLPTSDYETREGHSVVIGDSASGTADAQTIIGANATSNVANSVALGYASVADRGAQTNYTAVGLVGPQNSAGEVSIGSPGQERQITNVAPGSEATDAVNVAQLEGVAQTATNSVQYDDATKASVTLGGTTSTDGGATNGTTLTNLHQGALNATSTDAVNGAQLYATNQSIQNVYDSGIKYYQVNSSAAASSAVGQDSVAGGPQAVSTGNDAVALGNAAQAVGDNSVAIGNGATAQSAGATSIGSGNLANGSGAIAIGDPNTATGQGAIALGYENQATGQGAVALGSTSVANGASAIALGDTANASADRAIALGLNATASNAGDVALGSGAVTAAPNTGITAFFGGTAAGTATAVVSVGAPGAERQIQNVAPGTLTALSTDAVNGSQLYSVATGVNNLGTSVANAIGGSSTYNTSTGAVTTDLAYGGSSYSSVQDVINALTGGGPEPGIKYFHANSTGTDSNASGDNSVAIGPAAIASGVSSAAVGNAATAGADDAIALGDTSSAGATGAVAIGANANASMANSVALGAGSVTTVGALTDYTAYGLTAQQTSAGEVNVGNRQITGVAAGSADDDAVNVAQLKAVDDNVQSVDKLSVKYDADSSGNPTNSITLAGDGSGAPVTITNLAAGAETATSTDAVNGSQLWHWTQDTSNVYSNSSLYNDIQNIGKGSGTVKYFNVNSTLADSSATGSNSVAIGPTAKSSGTDSVALGDGASATADNSVAIGAGSVADRANTVSVGSAGNERQITNVAAGTEATDAVNVAQLDTAVTTSQAGTVRYDSNTDGSVNYGSITLGNGSSTATTIHNVAAGTAANDAVNVQQLANGMQQTLSWANAYTDQRFNEINGDIQKVGNRANAGVAAAMATAGLPQAYEPGKSMAAMSAGSFRGESSMAIGISTISEGGRWVYKVAASADTRGDAGVTIGAGMQW